MKNAAVILTLALLAFTVQSLPIEVDESSSERMLQTSNTAHTGPTLSDEDRKKAEKIIIVVSVEIVQDELNPIHVCEVTEKLFQKFISQETIEAELKGQPLRKADEAQLQALRRRYWDQLMACALARLAASPEMQKAIDDATKRAEDAGIFRTKTTATAELQLRTLLLERGVSSDDFDELSSGRASTDESYAKLKSLEGIRRKPEPVEPTEAEENVEVKQNVRSKARSKARSQATDVARARQRQRVKWHWHHRHHRHHQHFNWRNNNQKKAVEAATIVYSADDVVRANINSANLQGYSVKTLYHGSSGVDFAVFANGDDVILAYRGTESFVDWQSNLKSSHVTWPYSSGAGAVHAGFLGQFVESEGPMYSVMKSLYDDNKRRWLVTGHSLGGALATLAGFHLKLTFPSAQIDVITFGAPGAGSTLWTNKYKEKLGFYTASVQHKRDIVPCLPPNFSSQPQILHWASAWAWEDAKWHWARANGCWNSISISDHGLGGYCKILGASCLNGGSE